MPAGERWALWDVQALANPPWPRALSRAGRCCSPMTASRSPEVPAIASGLPGGLFLRGGDATRQFCPLAPHQTIDAAHLGALILLDSAAAEARLTRLSPNRAIEAVLSHRHRPHAPDLLGMRAKALRDCIGLARSIPVYAWGRPNAMHGAGFDEAALLARALIEENFGS